MSDLAALEALLERVEKAEGPDRNIDAALHVALEKPDQYHDDLRYYRLPSPSMDDMELCARGTYWLKQRSGSSLHTAPTYTASLDAALALCERKLPGWLYGIRHDAVWAPHHQWAGKPVWEAECVDPGDSDSASPFDWDSLDEAEGVRAFDAKHCTPALALLAAMLRALIAQGEDHD